MKHVPHKQYCLTKALSGVSLPECEIFWNISCLKILRMTSVPDSGSPVLVLARLGQSLECIS